ncbi:PDZ domain-containing protein [Candidatus Dojkabacteria bacterium]|nr:PDZ domain-containing protein [Candidatus Dojkabacteria bacterium]
MILLDFFLTIIVLVVLFGFLVFVHELGHFLAAKLIGVEVEEFAFGFGKRLWSKRYKDTLYRINLIPLGGYVKVLGDEDPSSFKQIQGESFSSKEKQKCEKQINQIAGADSSILSKLHAIENSSEIGEGERAEMVRYIKKGLIPNDPNFILKKGFWGRLSVYSAGVLMNILVAIAIFTLFLATTNFQTRIFNITEYPFIGADVQKARKPLVGNVYSESLIEDGFIVDEENLGLILLEIDGNSILDEEHFEVLWEEVEGREVDTKYQEVATGKVFEKTLLLNSEGLDINIEPELDNKVVIASVDSGSPADNAGLEAKDTILKLENHGTDFTENGDFLKFLEENAGRRVQFQVLSDEGYIEELEVDLREKEADELFLGASFQLNYIPAVSQYELDYGENKVLAGAAHTINVLGYNPVVLFEIISVSFEQKDPAIAGQSVTSIWGVGEHINTLVVGRDYQSIINIAGLVSVSLAFMNILPIPLLDGGQILFLIIEKLRGRPLGIKTQEKISQISFFLLVGLSIGVILKDIWLGFIGDFFRGIF